MARTAAPAVCVRVCLWVKLPRLQPSRAAVHDPRRTLANDMSPKTWGYFVIMGRDGVGGVGAAGEIANVTHAFQPEGRSDPSNSPYPLKLR